MKIYVRGELIDTKKEPVVILFSDDTDRNTHANNISAMEPRDAVRLYSIYPDSTPADEIRELMKQAKEKNLSV